MAHIDKLIFIKVAIVGNNNIRVMVERWRKVTTEQGRNRMRAQIKN